MELKSEKCGNFLTWETKSYLMVGVEDVLANVKVGSICTLPFDILLAYLGVAKSGEIWKNFTN